MLQKPVNISSLTCSPRAFPGPNNSIWRSRRVWGLSLSREGRIFMGGYCMWFHVFPRLDQTLAQMTRGILAWVLFFTNNRAVSSHAPCSWMRLGHGFGTVSWAGQCLGGEVCPRLVLVSDCVSRGYEMTSFRRSRRVCRAWSLASWTSPLIFLAPSSRVLPNFSRWVWKISSTNFLEPRAAPSQK